MTSVGDRVRAAREWAGLSPADLAVPGLSVADVQRLEAGELDAERSVLEDVANRLGVPVDRLLAPAAEPEAIAMEVSFASMLLVNGAAKQAVATLSTLDTSACPPQVQTRATFSLAKALEATGELTRAVQLVEPLLARSRASGHHLESAEQAMFLVGLYCELGDFARSVEIGEQVVAELERAHLAGTDEHVRLAATLTWTYKERGDLIFAIHKAAELIKVAEAAGSAIARGSILWNAAVYAQESGDHTSARQLAERALENLSRGDVSRDLSNLRQHFGWLLLRAEPPEPEEAIAHLDEAREQLTLIGSPLDLARCDAELARAHLMLGEPAEAMRLAEQALAEVPDGAVSQECEVRIVIGDIHAFTGDLSAASAQYTTAADRLGMFSMAREAAAVWRGLADRMVRAGDFEGAARAYAAALAQSGRGSSDYPIVSPATVNTRAQAPRA